MPVPFALLLGAFAGGALAWVAAPAGRKDRPSSWIAHPLGIVCCFSVLVLVPMAVYFVLFHGDWAYLYFASWRRIPSAVDLLVILAVAASPPLAFLFGGNLLRRGQAQTLIGALSGLAFLVLLLLISTSHRLAIDASYTEFVGGFAGQPVLAGALGRGVVLAWLVLSFGLFWTVQALRGRLTWLSPSRTKLREK